MKIVPIPLLLLGACAAGHRDLRKGIAKQNRCVAKQAQRFVGQPGTVMLAEKARQASGAILVRLIHLNEVVTMDHPEGRLNIALDGKGTVTGVACG